MTEEQLREIFREEIHTAFKQVGLADEDARDDVKDLRTLLKNYRAAQSTVIKTVVTFITLGVLSLISLGFYNRMKGGGE